MNGELYLCEESEREQEDLNVIIKSSSAFSMEQNYELQFPDDDSSFEDNQSPNKIQPPESSPGQGQLQETIHDQHNMSQARYCKPNQRSMINWNKFLVEIRLYFVKFRINFWRDEAFQKLKKRHTNEYPDLQSLQVRIRNVQNIIYQQKTKMSIRFVDMMIQEMHYNPGLKTMIQHFFQQLFHLYEQRSKMKVVLQYNFHLIFKPKQYICDFLGQQESPVDEINYQWENQDYHNQASLVQMQTREDLQLSIEEQNERLRFQILSEDNVLDISSSSHRTDNSNNINN